ncbi:hypothetical protein MPC1_2760001 [Methylocella tundrae]|nr:hypothetical protein MPC1_2760001 [Methylocella tundrae]
MAYGLPSTNIGALTALIEAGASVVTKLLGPLALHWRIDVLSRCLIPGFALVKQRARFDWTVALTDWLKPFVDKLGHEKRSPPARARLASIFRPRAGRVLPSEKNLAPLTLPPEAYPA